MVADADLTEDSVAGSGRRKLEIMDSFAGGGFLILTLMVIHCGIEVVEEE